MADTSLSLLDRLRDSPDDGSWQRLVEIYTPLIRGWLRRQSALEQDADDLVQEVLHVVLRKLPEFRRQEQAGSFRSWLRAIAVNCLRDHWRTATRRRDRGAGDTQVVELLDRLADPRSGLSRQWDREHDRHVAARLLQLIEPHFQPTTWRAFERVALDGLTPDAVADELGITVNAVFIAKSRVLTRLRQESRGLLGGA